MNILKLKPGQLVVGDVLIIEHESFVSDNRIELNGTGRDLKKFHKKQEGESGILLYEIDDVDIFFKDEEKEEGSIYQFYHMEESFSGMASIVCHDEDYLFDVICNPNYILAEREKLSTEES